MTRIVMIALSVCLLNCKHEKDSTQFDDDLFAQVTAGGYSYYQNGDTLSPAGNSPHGAFTLRFNNAANAALTDGELASGESFPTGSIIVKELVQPGAIRYVVMKKDPAHENSALGWLWAEFGADGTIVYSTGEKGAACTGCHSQTPNRDYTITFDLH